MSILATFSQWKETKKEILAETNPMVECPDCRGAGDSVCDCCGNDTYCVLCGGQGEAWYLEVENSYQFYWREYRNEMIADIGKLSAWTGKDFFLMVGDFISRDNKAES